MGASRPDSRIRRTTHDTPRLPNATQRTLRNVMTAVAVVMDGHRTRRTNVVWMRRRNDCGMGIAPH